MQTLLGRRYRLVDRIGRGGMGTVWHARDELLGREVAVKEVLLPVELDDTERDVLRRRAMREARAAARLSHPNVVTVYDVLEEDGRPWIVMELMHARSLADVVHEDGPLDVERVAAIGLDILDALGAAHAAGVLHRDVKPSNVLLSDDGRVVLTDFGIADVEGDPALTATGLLLGAPAYMAPERARGDAVRPEADLWSLGATLYTAVEGRPPFDAEGAMATLAAVVTQPPAATRRAGPLRPVLEGLLRKDPRERLSAAETRRMLERVLSGATDEAPTPQGPATARQRPAWVPLSLVALALLVAGVLGLLASRVSPGSSPPAANPAANPVQPASQDQQGSALDEAPAEGTVDAGQERQSEVPEGFSLHEDPNGFSIALPDGWEVARDGSAVYLREPGTGRFLLVDQTDDPKADPVADWQQQELARANTYPGYERIRIEAVDYFEAAADWEFTYRARGGRVHVLNRGFVTDDRGFALYWSTPEEQWDDSTDLFEVFAGTFAPEQPGLRAGS
jgi:hypothetical protein